MLVSGLHKFSQDIEKSAERLFSSAGFNLADAVVCLPSR
jgi:hypothetical protein